MSERVIRVELIDESRSQRGWTLRLVGERGLVGQAWLLSSVGEYLASIIATALVVPLKVHREPLGAGNVAACVPASIQSGDKSPHSKERMLF